jgi:hypothetical protein
MPNSSPPNPSPLKLDDYLGLFIAFTAIHSVLHYGTLNSQNEPKSYNKSGDSPPKPRSQAQSLPLPKLLPTPNPPESLSLPWITSLRTADQESLSLLVDKQKQARQPKSKELDEKTALASALNSPVSLPKPTAPTSTPKIEFSDVNSDDWASRFIQLLQQRNLVVGFPDGSFQPDQFATRGEFAAMLEKILGKENTQNGIDFKDVSADYWAFSAIKQVCQSGILKGYPAQDFRPDQPITRAEVLVALATALKLKTPSAPDTTLQVYLDSDQVLDYALPKVAAAQAAGLVAGYPKEKILVPNKPATRAELAALISQALAISEQKGNITKLASK